MSKSKPASSPAFVFFYLNAGYSYKPETETQKQGRARCAQMLADDEAAGREAGLSFDWSIDPHVTSAEWSDDEPAWGQWQCACYSADGECVASLHGIDFGRDGSPFASSYRRVVEAELAGEALSRIGASDPSNLVPALALALSTLGK